MISQFYLYTPRLSANGINLTCLCLQNGSWYSFTDPDGTLCETVTVSGLLVFVHHLHHHNIYIIGLICIIYIE